MTTPSNYYYTKDHEWIHIESENLAKVGITYFAQSELGDLVFVDIPKVGTSISKGKAFCVVESTKAASDVYAPINAEVCETNASLTDKPELVNQSPYDSGWICKIKNYEKNDITTLMTAEQYDTYLHGKK